MRYLSTARRIFHRGVVLPTVFCAVVAGLALPEQPSAEWSDVLSVPFAHAQQTAAASCRVVSKARALKKKQKYRKAQQLLQGCVTSRCSDTERTRCASALQTLESSIPSIVVLVSDGSGNDVVDVSVQLDGETLVTSLDGQAIAVDPGEHQFVFEREGAAPVTRTVKLAKGQKFRAIQIEMIPQMMPSVAEPAAATADGGAMGRWVGGATLGVVGLAGGIGFALAGAHARSEEEGLQECQSTGGCPQGRIDSVEARYRVANAALAVGVVSLGAAVWVLLSGDSSASQGMSADTAQLNREEQGQVDGKADSVSWDWSLQPNENGGGLQLSGQF